MIAFFDEIGFRGIFEKCFNLILIDVFTYKNISQNNKSL